MNIEFVIPQIIIPLPAVDHSEVSYHYVHLFLRIIELFKPPYHYSNSPYWSQYISLSTNWENLLRDQDNSFVAD